MANPQYARPQYKPVNSTANAFPPVARKETFEMPKLEATFVPGGFDDYYMPEVIAPSPQRVMPEVPHNMQEDLQRMELEARQPTDRHNERPQARDVPDQQRGREPSLSNYLGASTSSNAKPSGSGTPSPAAIEYQYQNSPAASAYTQNTAAADFKPLVQDRQLDMPAFEVPSFSPFPRITQDNVPPSDDEKERILFGARQDVLRSNNVSVQLEWALDVLFWVEIAQDAYARENKEQGTRPQTPRIEHELRNDALRIVEYLATQSHPQALFSRSKWLEFGKFGYRQDKNEAFLGYMNAADRGWGRAEYRIGMIYENSNDVKNALQHYNRGLALQDSASSYRLGMMNLLGQHGHVKDYRAGLDLIKSAADTADEESPQGAYVFGMLISRELPDINIPEGMMQFTLAQARQYIEKSAYFGFAKAQLKMGQAYELCQLGCDFNPALSLHYYGLAARQGQSEAALGVSRWFLFGYEGVFVKNEQLAFKYAREAADAKLPTGEFAMGYYYEIGIYVQKDLRDARTWYERAADHGNKDAQNRLEGLSQAKTLTKQDHETTALTRIKSKHGSMRGQRPERFSSRNNPAALALSTLSESAPAIPDEPEPAPKVVTTPPADRPPVFAINIDNSLAMRPKSTAPYPDDDHKPAPLNLARPKSAAPYPDDDPSSSRLPRSPHYNAQIRPSNGPQGSANRPVSAFGIRPANANPAPPGGGARLPVSQSMNNLMPDTQQRPFSVGSTGRPLDSDPRGRIASAGWEPQVGAGRGRGAGAGPGPGPGGPGGPGGSGGPGGRGSYDYGYPQQPQQQQQRPPSQQGPPNPRLSGGLPPQPDRNRLSKTNPNTSAPAPGGYGNLGPAGANPAATAPGSQPGREYGPRTSSRPSSAYSAPPASNGRPDRLDSLPSQGGGGGGGRFPINGGPGGNPSGNPQMFKNNGHFNEGGRQSAPPVQLSGGPGGPGGPGGYGSPASVRPVSAQQQPSRLSSGTPQAGPGPASRPAPAQAAKPAKPAPQGPATFEEMGIPQGKGDDDCVIM
ncbi:chitin synthase activator [Ophiostoma piceae UAMH 11346]|uniref:Chitin synthase activator n=1 Tax=Ophiostoma piceae (strain UAMH 11346) TaxID=1262450 RepID=S3BSG0_OPHP1|nr:chitin synthase activator [Ophiostoma piceae UAMH 11346]